MAFMSVTNLFRKLRAPLLLRVILQLDFIYRVIGVYILSMSGLCTLLYLSGACGPCGNTMDRKITDAEVRIFTELLVSFTTT